MFKYIFLRHNKLTIALVATMLNFIEHTHELKLLVGLF